MAVSGFWKAQEVDGIKNWIRDLTTAGYIEPVMIINDQARSVCSDPANTQSLVDQQFPVRFTPKFQNPIDFITYSAESALSAQAIHYQTTLNYFTKFCHDRNYTLFSPPLSLATPTLLQQSNKIVLVITFNHEPLEDNILLLKHAYGSYFQNIVFCGANAHKYMAKFRLNYAKLFDSFTLIDSGPIVDGYLHYHCMARVYEMNFNTALLLMSDDVLLKYWRVDKLDVAKIWYPFELKCAYSMPESLSRVTKECMFEGKN